MKSILGFWTAMTVFMRVAATDLEECQDHGWFYGNLLEQPHGCWFNDTNGCSHNQTFTLPGITNLNPLPEESTPCGTIKSFQIKPIFYVPKYVDDTKHDVYVVDQSGDGQIFTIKECKVESCEKEVNGENKFYKCETEYDQVDIKATLEGSVQEEDLSARRSSDCKCNEIEKPSGRALAYPFPEHTSTEATSVGSDGSSTTSQTTTTVGVDEEFEMRANRSKQSQVVRRYNVQTNLRNCTAHRHGIKPSPCVFPFAYRGVQHHGCIKQDDSQYWCSIAVDENRNYIAKEWGYCSAQCPIELPDCKTIDGPVVKALCKFPFVYKHEEYYDCTSVDDSRQWCATETDKHGYLLEDSWGYCQCEKDQKSTTVTTTTISFSSSDGGGGTTTPEMTSPTTTFNDSTTTPSVFSSPTTSTTNSTSTTTASSSSVTSPTTSMSSSQTTSPVTSPTTSMSSSQTTSSVNSPTTSMSSSPTTSTSTSPTTSTSTSPTTTTSTSPTTTTSTSTTTTVTVRSHIPVSFDMMPTSTLDGVAVYIPSVFDDPILAVIEDSGTLTYRPNSNYITVQ